jgi:hypothetical protein
LVFGGVSLLIYWRWPCTAAAPPNNGMHPTANSAAFIRKTPCPFCCVRGGWCRALGGFLGCCWLIVDELLWFT